MEKILSQHLLSGFQPHFSKFPISHVLLILNDLKNHFSDNSCSKEPLMRKTSVGGETEVKVILKLEFSERFGCLVFKFPILKSP